jgi:hypothetical protein
LLYYVKDALALITHWKADAARFARRLRRLKWPDDLDGHSAYHRVKDIEQSLAGS